MSNKIKLYNDSNLVYKFDSIERIMTKKLLDDRFGFRKDGLEFLLKKYDKKIVDFVEEIYSKSEVKIKQIQISKLLNKKKNAPKYYTEIDLANDLAHWFNQFRVNGDDVIAPTFFLGNSANIDVVGALYNNGQIDLYKKKDIKKVLIHPRYSDCVGVICKSPPVNGMIKVFKPRKSVYANADNRLGFAQDKKSKIIYLGFIEPKSNGRYDITDKSTTTGKTCSTLAENIELLWSSRLETGFFPSYWEY
tara:strand:- start:479 stop:1222 length:744 start_codon:yes stop_codon:yes gene_type:complete